MRIAVIDTGLGGLDILNKMIKKYPNNEYIYLCDNYNCPYGVKYKEEVNELVIKILDFLESLNINLLVVACNTISTFIDNLRQNYSYPIYTILDYNAKIINERYKYKKISIIATSLTIRSEAYFYKTNDIDIQFVNGSYLTKLIEDGNEEKIENEIKTLIKQCDKDSDAILLGCTHYALYKNVFMKKCCSKLFIEGSKELIYDLPLDKFNNKKDINIILTKDDDDYLLKINKFINSKYNIHKIKL